MPRTPSKYRDNPNYDAFAQLGNSEREFRETSNLMTKSQVAVYPVDSRGLMVSSAINIQSSGTGMAGNPKLFQENEDDFVNDSFSEHSTMQRMASDTGGRAFINTNDFSGAIESAVEDGASYYTLAYTPTNTRWRGDLRQISVKLSHPGYTLSYRHGYYADDPESVTSAVVHADPSHPGPDPSKEARGRLDESDLIRVMGHGMPSATQVSYRVSIFPVVGEPEADPVNGSVSAGPGYGAARGPFRRYRVGFRVDPRRVELRKDADGMYRGLLEFAAWVLDADGRPVTTRTRQMQVAANAAQYEHLVGETINMTVEISVPAKGQYSIRTGVLDISTRSVGATEVSLSQVKDLPPVPAVLDKTGLKVRSK